MSVRRKGFAGVSATHAAQATRVFVSAGVIVAFLICLTGAAAADSGDSGDPLMTHLSDAALRQAQEQAAEMQASAQEGDGSHTDFAYNDLSRRGALSLAEGTFGGRMQDAAAAYADVDIQHFLSDTTAVVEVPRAGNAPGTKRVFEDSSLPLRAENDQGEKTPVDLHLQASGDAYEPANPLVNVKLPRQLDQGIVLPDADVSLVPEGPGDPASMRTGADSVFYPDVAKDTDFIATPTPRGVETYSQLRSADSPLSQSYRLETQPGDTFHQEGDEGIAVIRDGHPVGLVHPPSTIDANGRPVPTSMAVADGTLRVTVHPGQADLAYPLLVDPVIDNIYRWYPYYSDAGFDAWSAFAWYPFASLAAHVGNPWNLAPGLWITSAAGPQPAGQTALWSYYVPRWLSDQNQYHSYPSTYIYEADYGGIYSNNGNGYAWSPVLFDGIWNRDLGWSSQNPNQHYLWYPQYSGFDAVQAAPDSRNQATSFGLVGIGGSAPDGRYAFTGSTNVFLDDPYPPQVDQPVGSDGDTGSASNVRWVDHLTTTVSAHATDDGLGMKSFTVTTPDTTAPGGSRTANPALTCSGGATSPCPREYTTPAQAVDTTTFPEGVNQVTFTANDAGGKAASKAWTIGVDRSLPQVSVTGGLTDGTGTDLSITATDGSPTNNSTKSSGVKSIQVAVDGVPVQSLPDQPCPQTSCSRTMAFSFNRDAFSRGIAHTVTVTATDEVGHTSLPTVVVAKNPAVIQDCSSYSGGTPPPGPLPGAVVDNLPDGGHVYTYLSAQGFLEDYPVPPSSFNPVTASSADLEQYGLPERPTDPDDLAEWQQDMADAHVTDPPAPCTEASDRWSSPDRDELANVYSSPASTAYLKEFSGYTAQPLIGGNTHFNSLRGAYNQPHPGVDPCDTSRLASWIGLGASSNALLQMGTYIRNDGNMFSWWQALARNDADTPINHMSVGIAPTNRIVMTVTYNVQTNRVTFWMLNRSSGDWESVKAHAPANNYYDGQDVSWVEERQESQQGNPSNIKNYDTVNWSQAYAHTTGGSSLKLANLFSKKLIMSDNGAESGNYLSAPGDIMPDHVSFNDNWRRCH